MLSFSVNPPRLSSARSLLLAVSVAAGLTAQRPTSARAQPGDGLDWSYLVDGGVIPFVYGSTAAYLGYALLVSARDTPLGFSDSEGGAPDLRETVPTYMLYGLVGATSLGVALPRTNARWYHFKGLAQSVATTAFVTELTKDTFGRHRPYYDPATSTDDTDRKSFFSGHASLTLAVTSYAGLYFHSHLFARWRRPDQSFAWWEAFPLAALAGLAVYVPYTRVADNQHHLSDVLTGAAVGAATSIAFYTWQELRFRRSRTGLEKRRSGRVEAMLVPSLDQPGASLLVWF